MRAGLSSAGDELAKNIVPTVPLFAVFIRPASVIVDFIYVFFMVFIKLLNSSYYSDQNINNIKYNTIKLLSHIIYSLIHKM
jgi:hypothetical protein